MVENDDIRYYHGDHLGSSNLITNSDGNQISRYEYKPFGEVATSIGDPGSSIKHLYTGKELDDTGLYYYGARYYDPLIGRFISPDSFVQAPSDPQSLNRYAYVRNNPLKYIDPTGHFWFIAVIVGAILGGVGAAINNQSIGQGMLMGALGGLLVGAGAEIFGFWGGVGGGILGGSANSAVAGGEIWIGALSGGIGAGLGFGFGSLAGSENFWGGLAASASSGALSGGIAAELGGGEFGEGAMMGAAFGSAGFLGSEAFSYGINNSDARKAQELELSSQDALNVDRGEIEAKASVENKEILEVYKRGLEGSEGALEVHPYMKKGDTFFESHTMTDRSGVTTIDIRSGSLSEMSKATQNHYKTNPKFFRKVSVYTKKFNAAIQSYRAETQGMRYLTGSFFRDCRNFPTEVIRDSRVK